MAEANLSFYFKDRKFNLKCITSEKMSNICEMFAKEAKVDVNDLFFLYNDNIINKELKFEEQINIIDKDTNGMKIKVKEINKKQLNKNKIFSKGIVCPKCYDNINIKIEDYIITMYNCKNNHKLENLQIKDFIKKQIIDISKIKCSICNEINENNKFNNEIYKCLTCNNNLCPVCKEDHDHNHRIVNFEKRNIICNKHNDLYTQYCNDCHIYMCLNCEKDHMNHNILNYDNSFPYNYNVNELNNYIDKFRNEIEGIIMKLKNILETIEIYKSINNNIFKNKNYQTVNNLKEIINHNNIMINDIKEAINDYSIINRFKNIMNFYDKINNINNSYYIVSELDIKEKDINKNIRIINSFEQCKREKLIEGYGENDNQFENEREIKECIIKVNNKTVPFNYFYKFKEKGKYQIQYIFNENIDKLDYMFYDCSSIAYIDLSYFNIKNIINMNSMFYGCNSLKDINLYYFNAENVINMGNLFQDCKSITKIDLSNSNTKNVINMDSIFRNCISLTNINLTNFNTQNVINMCNMFNGCSSISQINLTNFNTQKVTNMSFMFNGCSSLSNINLANFETYNVIDMSYMFFGCKSLTNLNLSNFYTNKVTNLSYMFFGCSSLKALNIMNFITNNVTNMGFMFDGCYRLIKLNLSNFNTKNVTNMKQMFYECKSLIELNLANFNTQKVIYMSPMFLGCSSLDKKNIITRDINILNLFKN